jgi:hypothetical protein
VVALAAFAVYAWLCAPVSGVGDESEFTLVLATGGVAHPTGYPLYTFFGHLFCAFLRVFGFAWPHAASLWSAVGGAVAVGFLHALGMELVGAMPVAADSPRVGAAARFLAAVVPTSLFAFQPILLGEATSAEVNSWSIAWVCGAAWTFVRLQETLALEDQTESARRRVRAAALWGLVCGIGLAHHLTSVLISVPLSAGLIVTLARRRGASPALLAVAGGAALLPLASYGIIAWHAWHPARVQWPWLEPGLGSVVSHITGTQYRQYLGSFAPTPLQRELLARAAYPFLFPGLALLLVGVLRAKEPGRRIVWSSVAAAALIVTGFTFCYGVPDPAPYFLPAMALGVAAAAPALAAIPGAGSRAGTYALAAAGLACGFVVAPWVREGGEVRGGKLYFDDTIHSMWAAIPPDTAIVSWTDDCFYKLREYQLLRGEKPALLVVMPDLLFTESMRRTVRLRFGADPVAGLHFPSAAARPQDEEAFLKAKRLRLMSHVNERVRVPVILFDPAAQIVWQMRKPWEPPDVHGASPGPGGHGAGAPITPGAGN